MHRAAQPELSERDHRHPLVAADDRPQAHRAALFRLDHFFFFIGGSRRP